jgi:mRNA-degrading endonuclease RelE of RelBE toxin-antitoxin system
MTFRVTFAPTAVHSGASLPNWAQTRFDGCFTMLEKNPRRAASGLDVHQLFGYQNVWTLRIPPYRGIYAIEADEVVMIVFGHRDSVYPRLHQLIPLDRGRASKTALAKRR